MRRCKFDSRAGGGELVFPNGFYDYSDGLEFISPVTLRGEGATLNYTGTGKAIKLGPDNLTALTRQDGLYVTADNRVWIGKTGKAIGFFGASPQTKPIVTGSRGGDAVLGSLITALANLGLLTDSTTA